ncbi:VAN3-binding protein-like [Juglans regia]|uniref:VAN3-binding protein-like n=1 Tax=Juglans regia TaxID=51240 RepID=A0A6P9DUI0_JUGRE|nr:VAN3-binding protein-like [Juglans regia]
MDSKGAFRAGRISFKNEHQSAAYNLEGKSESWTRSAHGCLTTNENPSCRSLDILQGPVHAMEFLCRPWSPSATNFMQIISSSTNLLFPSQDSCYLGRQEEKLHDDHTLGEQGGKAETEKTKETKGYAAQSNRSTFSRALFTIERSVPSFIQKPKFFASLLRRRVKTKEEDRLRTANVHATLSVACLAAAIAGIAANSTKEAAKDVIPISNGDGGKVAWDKNMGDIVASAAALIATVCAETAESIGANRAHVASAVNSGLAAQTPVDMITLTATAATCLRGAAILKSRAMAYDSLSRCPELLEVGAQLAVVTPSGHKRHMRVSIYFKRKQLILSLEKKFLGVLTTLKKYKIFHVTEETEEAHGNFSISLKSHSGDIKVWFEDENQWSLWVSVISNLLQMHKSY